MKRIFKTSLLFVALSGLFLLSSCSKEARQLEEDIELIKQYLTDNNLTADVAEESGLHIVIEKEGSGDSPNYLSKVIISYTGYYLDGTVFDSTGVGTSYQVSVANTIEGWQDGLPYFKVGGRGKLLIPSGMGYGTDPANDIRSDAVLIFDIDLVDVI